MRHDEIDLQIPVGPMQGGGKSGSGTGGRPTTGDGGGDGDPKGGNGGPGKTP